MCIYIYIIKKIISKPKIKLFRIAQFNIKTHNKMIFLKKIMNIYNMKRLLVTFHLNLTVELRNMIGIVKLFII